MTTVPRNGIDQALFGYSDGHRQIASSLRLPPKDLYLLSAASDLATGARLSEGESYLSGLPLPESRRYALFRTWSAPEMPRPGCVWSHVLLLSSKTSASIPSLSEILPLFHRPSTREPSFYGDQLDVPTSRLVEPARIDLIEEIISSYYTSGRATLSPEGREPEEIEKAVMAVWSQQWPRLRSSFSFCTARLSEIRRMDQNEYSVQFAPLDEAELVSREDWVSIASIDAAQNIVSPLRRFLWRYGRDVSASRRAYSMFVNLFARFGGADQISAEAALDVFKFLPDRSEGAVLKRDILGIGPNSPRLIAAISAVDLFKLQVSGSLQEPLTPAQVADKLETSSPREINSVARYYAANQEVLLPWKDEIYRAISAVADKSALTTEYPPDVIAGVLLAREDLVDRETLALVKNDVLPRLIKESSSASLAHVVMGEMLRRDMGNLESPTIISHPELAFLCAIDAYRGHLIHQSWLVSFAHHVGIILDSTWLSRLTSTKAFAAALSILRYPRSLSKRSAEIVQRLSEMIDDAQGDERTMMLVTLLRTAIDEDSFESWHLIGRVLPELRTLILHRDLPQIAESMLIEGLPKYDSAAYWDLDKRILLSLSKLYAHSPNKDVLERLKLEPTDRALVLDGEERPAMNPFAKFWPWLS